MRQTPPPVGIVGHARRTCAALWTFTKVENVEPTNNAAESALRKAVLWRKGSFGSHSAEGSRFAERMLTVSESLRVQGRSILEFLEALILARLAGDMRPSLMPALACSTRISA